MSADLALPSGRTIAAEALEVRTSRASGPGGQHVNKTDSKVSLELHLDRLGWSESDLLRLREKLRPRLTNDDRLVIHAETSRHRLRNLEEARRRLAEVVEAALHVPKRRHATKPSLGAKRRRLEDKKRVGEKKQQRKRISWD